MLGPKGGPGALKGPVRLRPLRAPAPPLPHWVPALVKHLRACARVFADVRLDVAARGQSAREQAPLYLIATGKKSIAYFMVR